MKKLEKEIGVAIDMVLENMGDPLSFDIETQEIVDAVMDVIKKELHSKTYTFNYTPVPGMSNINCGECTRPFGTWSGSHHSFTDEKLFYPGTKIYVFGD